ncbi:MAG: phage baseplate assembly protein V [Sphingomonadales bacterium]
MDQIQVLGKTVQRQAERYYGKYRGFVDDNKDKEGRGRVKLLIPTVLGKVPSEWALPCFPYGGIKNLGFFAVPPEKSQVFVEFLEGDISSPVWTGTFWRESSEVPEEINKGEPTTKLIKTDSGHVFLLEDKNGEETVLLKSSPEAQLEMNPGGGLQLTDQKGATVFLDAEAGELSIKDANGNEMIFSSSGITATDASGNEITTTGSGVTVKGATVTIEGQQVILGGSGGEPLIKGTSFMTFFNTHMHTSGPPGSPTTPPVVPMTPGQLSTTSTST